MITPAPSSLFLAATLVACAPGPSPPTEDVAGRWNVRITDAEDTFASGQIDVEEGEGGVAVSLVWRSGSYNPATKAWIEGGVLHIVRKQKEGEDRFEARVVDGTLVGTVRYPEGEVHHFEGRRAPELPTPATVEWGEPLELFDGKTLDGWSLRDPDAKMGWAVVDGELAVVEPKDNADLVSDRKFQDMKLHLEFNVEPRSNSGVYLRGRYEVQILDDPEMTGDTHGAGALYSRVAPRTDATKPAGEWQTYDITLVGRDLTVVLNGTEVVSTTVDGLTGGAINPFEDQPGPLMLQGDHGKVRFRNIVVTPAK